MRIGNLEISFKEKAQEVNPPQSESAYMNSLIYSINDFRRYNPDDLIGVKGFRVYRLMLRDEQVKAAARFRRNAVTGRKWHFTFDKDVSLSDEEQARRIKFFEASVKQMRGSFKRKLDGIQSALFYGFSLTEKTYKPIEIDGQTYWGIKNLRTKPFETFRFETDEYGNLESLKQEVDGAEITLDIGNFVHHIFNADIDENFGQSELREAYRAYFSKDIIIKLQNIYLERMAGGFIWAQPSEKTQGMAAGGTRSAQGGSTETKLANVLRNIQTKTGIIMPRSWDLNVEHPHSTDAFERAIISYNLGISKSLMMPNLLGYSEQGKNGSRALGETQLESFLWMLDAEANDLEETLNEDLFRDLGDFNFGDGIYPEFNFKPLSKAMIKVITETWGNLIQKGAVTHTETDEEHLRDIMDFPEKGEEIKKPASEGGDIDTDDDIDPNKGPAVKKKPEEKAEEEPDETLLGKGQIVIDYTKFNRAERRVDFAQIDRSANVMQWQGVEHLSQAMEDITKWSMAQIAETPGTIEDPLLVKKATNIPASLKKKVKKTIHAILVSGWDLGTNTAKSEVDKVRPDDRFSKEQMQKFASIGSNAAKYFAAKEFLVTGKLLEDYNAVVANGILQGVKYGKSSDQVINSIMSNLASKGMLDPEFAEQALGEALNVTNPRARLETIVRTNSFDAINEARFDFFTSPEMGGFVTALEYSAILDGRTTEICRRLDNNVMLAGSSEWNKYRPPNHFNCRSLLIAVTQFDDIAVTGLDDQVASGETQPAEGFS